mmetsp:Transcript_11423/g.17229  ORF Transcript_11423/g.17229 Transcript_11423/m.17229 type:complete len:84 (+) Transcript_11423:843-1094(+)
MNWNEGCMLASSTTIILWLTRSDSAGVLKRTPAIGLHRLKHQLHSRNKRRIRSFYEDIDKEEIGAGNNVPEDEVMMNVIDINL